MTLIYILNYYNLLWWVPSVDYFCVCVCGSWGLGDGVCEGGMVVVVVAVGCVIVGMGVGWRWWWWWWGVRCGVCVCGMISLLKYFFHSEQRRFKLFTYIFVACQCIITNVLIVLLHHRAFKSNHLIWIFSLHGWLCNTCLVACIDDCSKHETNMIKYAIYNTVSWLKSTL